MSKATTLAIIGIIFFSIVLIIAVYFIIWGSKRVVATGPPCTADNQCPNNQSCINNYCDTISCSVNSDCPSNPFQGQTCINGYCSTLPCQLNSDCPSGNICGNGTCVPVGSTCNSNSDCFGGDSGLVCSNTNASGTCVQCRTNIDCLSQPGTFCGGDGICYANCNSEGVTCPDNTTCNSTGTCCPNDFVSDGVCGGSTGKTCGAGFCVNKVCNCSKGTAGDTCSSGPDCDTGTCIQFSANSNEGVCAKNTGDTCFYNYSVGNSSAAYCQDPNNPYCANGRCTSSPLGAPCSCTSYNSTDTNIPPLCTQFSACNVIVPLTSTESGSTAPISNTNSPSSTLYCVNSVCSSVPGTNGQECTSNQDCSSVGGNPPKCLSSQIQGSILTCQ